MTAEVKEVTARTRDLLTRVDESDLLKYLDSREFLKSHFREVSLFYTYKQDLILVKLVVMIKDQRVVVKTVRCE